MHQLQRRVPMTIFAILSLIVGGLGAVAAGPPASEAASHAPGSPPALPFAGEIIRGYDVSDEGGIPFLSTYRALGPEVVGYPISRRFTWNGFTVQAFQKAVMQWQPQESRVAFLNTFDVLHERGFDPWLATVRSTPPPLPPSFDAGATTFEEITARRLSLLGESPAISASYYAAPDPLVQFGLPVSHLVDNGNHWVMRFQRAVFQLWKEDVPWAARGQVTIANGGDILREAGLLPDAATTPTAPVTGAAPPPPAANASGLTWAPGAVPAGSTATIYQLAGPPAGTRLADRAWDQVIGAWFEIVVTAPNGERVQSFAGPVTIAHPGTLGYLLDEATGVFQPLPCTPGAGGLVNCALPRPGTVAIIRPVRVTLTPASPASGGGAQIDWSPGAVPAGSNATTYQLAGPPAGTRLPDRSWDSVVGAWYELVVTGPNGERIQTFAAPVTVIHAGSAGYLLNEATGIFEPLACTSAGAGRISCRLPRPGTIAIVSPVG